MKATPKALHFFRGKTAIVTGGTRGLGLAITRQLLAYGAKVAVCARDPAELEAAREGFGSAGVFVAQCDVTELTQVESFVAEAAAALGAPDILINNAGTIVVGPYADMTVDDIRRVVDVNFFGAVNAIAVVLPGMRQRKSGHIVNVGSIGGIVGVPHLAAYCAAKFALSGFSQTIRAELRREHIRVTLVNPGLMRTGSPMNATFKGNNKAEYAWFAVSDSLPLVTISAERAALQILEACRIGRPLTVLTGAAKLAAFAHAFAPNAFVRAMSLINAFLPKATGRGGHYARGHESESGFAPSPLTTLTESAARANNELSARRPVTDLPG